MFSANVFRKEMRLGRRGFIVWAAVMVAFVLIYLSFHPYALETGMAETVEGYPEIVTAGLNLTRDTIADINLYHANVVMAYGLLLVSIYALMLAGGLVSRDPDLGTADFLYTRPVTRRQILASKVAAFLVTMVALWALIFLTGVAVGMAVAPDTFNVGRQLVAHLAGLLATLAAGGVAFALAPFIDRVQATTSLGAGLGLGFFFVNAISRMTGRLAFFRYFSIHHYAGIDSAARGEPFVAGMLALLLIAVAGVGLGLVFLGRKEFAA